MSIIYFSGGSLESYVTQGLNTNVQTHGCVVSDYSQSFKVIFGVHPAFLLIPLLFIIVFEALLRS